MSLLYEELTDKILGACLEVYNQLGCGFLEAVYSDALEFEFELMNIPYKREKIITSLIKERGSTSITRLIFSVLIR